LRFLPSCWLSTSDTRRTVSTSRSKYCTLSAQTIARKVRTHEFFRLGFRFSEILSWFLLASAPPFPSAGWASRVRLVQMLTRSLQIPSFAVLPQPQRVQPRLRPVGLPCCLSSSSRVSPPCLVRLRPLLLPSSPSACKRTSSAMHHLFRFVLLTPCLLCGRRPAGDVSGRGSVGAVLASRPRPLHSPPLLSSRLPFIGFVRRTRGFLARVTLYRGAKL